MKAKEFKIGWTVATTWGVLPVLDITPTPDGTNLTFDFGEGRSLDYDLDGEPAQAPLPRSAEFRTSSDYYDHLAEQGLTPVTQATYPAPPPAAPGVPQQPQQQPQQQPAPVQPPQ